MNVQEAITKALRENGAELLSEPRRLVSYILDYAEEDGSREVAVLSNYCDEGTISPFREAVEAGTAEALSTATERCVIHLVDDCVIDRGVARHTAEAIAAGIAEWSGIAYVPAASADETLWMDPFASSEVVPLIPTAQVTSAVDPAVSQRYPDQGAIAYPSTVPGQFRPEAHYIAPRRRSGALIGGIVGACVALLLVGVIYLVSSRMLGASDAPQTDVVVSEPDSTSEPEATPQPDPDSEVVVEESEESEPETPVASQELVTLMASDYDGVIMRSGAGNTYSEVASLDPSVVMDYYGESETGPSSRGTSIWYKVIALGKEGWVCGDYVEELPGTVTVLAGKDGDPINMRMLPQYGSPVVGQSKPGATIYWYGQVQQGVCSDGVVRDWYIINSGSDWGWARADNLVLR